MLVAMLEKVSAERIEWAASLSSQVRSVNREVYLSVRGHQVSSEEKEQWMQGEVERVSAEARAGRGSGVRHKQEVDQAVCDSAGRAGGAGECLATMIWRWPRAGGLGHVSAAGPGLAG
jgi:hypothetical protein